MIPLLKQFKANRISILMGAGKEMVGRMSFYVQIAVLCFTGVTFWDSPKMISFRNLNTWLSFELFIGIVVILAIVVLIFEYAFVMPGSYAFSTRQFLTHENKMARDIEQIKKKLNIKEE